jgi:metal-dependent hydrolase (beta-lactamase superfamily II)
MKLSTQNKFDLALLHGFPICAVCNKPVESIQSMDDISSSRKLFRVHCHGETEEAFLNDEMIENTDSVRFGQAFIDKLPQTTDWRTNE